MNQWSFLGTDIDPISLEWAQKNVNLNNWSDSIELRRAEVGRILCGVLKDDEEFAFCMCNPPFFESVEEKVPNPKTALEATSNELATEGGEVAFISQIVDDSVVLGDRIQWYTSMIGRKATLKKIQQKLRDLKIVNVRTTTFYQGTTTRWAIGWSHGRQGMEESVREKTKAMILGKPEFTLRAKGMTLEQLKAAFETACRGMEVKFQSSPTEAFSYTCKLYDNSAWLKTIGRDITSEATTPMIGMDSFVPPKVLLTFSANLVQLSQNAPLMLHIKHLTGELEIFADVCVEYKQQINN